MPLSRAGGVFDTLAPRYDRGNRWISLGQDLRWKRRCVAAVQGPCLDAGAGTGDLARMLEGRGERVVSVDASRAMLAAGRTPGAVVGDAQRLPVGDGRVAGVVSGFLLRNLPDVDAFLAEVHRVLMPGGTAALLEIAYPDGRARRAMFSLYFHRIVPWIGALTTRQRAAYKYLSESLRTFAPPAEIASRAAAHGLRTVSLERGRWSGMFLLVLRKP